MPNVFKSNRGPARAPAALRSLRLILATALVPAVLIGCAANRVTQYTEVQSEPKNELMWVTLEHEVGFEVGEAKLSDAEAARLDQFLAEIAVSNSDSLVIDPGSFRGGIVEPRLESVSTYIEDRLPTMNYRIGHLGWEESDEAFRILVGRYLVIPPKCPNFESSSVRNPNNLRSSNFGCATETNLALMIANPADLLHGQPYVSSDGKIIADSVQRYRTRAVEEVEEVSSTEGGG